MNTVKHLMSRALPLLVCLSAFLFISFGYAAISNPLAIKGNVSARTPDYDEVVITKITPISDPTNSKSSVIAPTNIRTDLSGEAGQTVVYQVTAHNFSKDTSYVYAGIVPGTEFFEDSAKVDAVATKDAEGSSPLINDVAATYYESDPIAPGEEVVFYVRYTLKEALTAGELMINYVFRPIVYTVTYLNSNETFATHHVTDNSVAYTVLSQAPPGNGLSFAGWMNANAIVMSSFPAGNTHDYTLSAKWDNIYMIIFSDADGTVLYEEQITDSSTSLSAEGQRTVDAILAELNTTAAANHMSVSWSEYDIAGATADILVKAIYNYNGVLGLEPVYEQPDDGIADYYKIVAVDTLPETVEVPGVINGLPVKVVERITNVDGEQDWANFETNVKTIVIHEGVERLEHNSLAWTPNLGTVMLPNTLQYLGKNTFSRNIALGGFGRGDDKKVLTIEYNGTKAEWREVVANSDSNWDGGLKRGSIVRCSDGYFSLEGTFSLSWKEKSY